MMKCPNCGTENDDGVRFCKGCGANLQNVSAPTHTPSQAKGNNNILIICVAIVLCVLIIGAVVIFTSGSDDSDDNVAVNDSNDGDSVDSSDDSSASSDSLSIKSGYIFSSDFKQTFCTVNVGEQFAGEDVKISVLYSRDGSNLNNGNIVDKTVSDIGEISVPTADVLNSYPDKAIITIYDSVGNPLDTKTVKLKTDTSTQYF